jgi:hypothetical protein
METKEKTLKNTHHGHAIKRIRHTMGIKQDALAIDGDQPDPDLCL